MSGIGFGAGTYNGKSVMVSCQEDGNTKLCIDTDEPGVFVKMSDEESASFLSQSLIMQKSENYE